MVTEFTDHICVTMDAELIMFLHDLVSAYLKEKEKGFCPVAPQKTAPRLRFHAAGHMLESGVKCGKLSIIFTRAGWGGSRSATPTAFQWVRLLWESDKSALCTRATSHPRRKLEQRRVDSAAEWGENTSRGSVDPHRGLINPD